jgi:hypothetical protein
MVVVLDAALYLRREFMLATVVAVLPLKNMMEQHGHLVAL